MLRKILIPYLLAFAWPAFGQSLEAHVDSLFSSVNQPGTPGAAVVIMRGDSVPLCQGVRCSRPGT